MATEVSCYYGQSGSGKSRAAVERALVLHKETGLKTRVIIGDGGAATFYESGLVEDGIIEMCEYGHRHWPMTVVQRLADGWFPTGGDPLGELVAATWEDVSKSGVGMVVFEGASVMAKYAMGNIKGALAERASRGEKIGQDSPIQILAEKGGETFGGNPMAHYNVAQNLILNAIERSKGFPGVVLWSAHESQGEDKTASEKVLGPEVIGKALTASLPRYFTHTLHFTVAESGTKKAGDAFTGKQVTQLGTEYRLYTRDHFDPDAMTFVKYKAVTRCALPALMPDYFVSPKGDPGKGIRDFYNKLKEIKETFKSGRVA